MPWKTDENGNLETNEGNPIWVHDDGKEAPFDAGSALRKISELNAEAADRRRKLSAAQERLSAYSDIEDPAAALAAMQKVQNLQDKKLIDAGEVDALKERLTKELQEKLAAKDGELESLNRSLHKEMIGGRFSRSKFIKENVAIPADMVERYFGQHFTIEDGRVVAKDAKGNVITSHENFGEPAGFDEALETLVNNYSHKDAILKATGSTGSGTKPGTTSTGVAGAKTINRADQSAFEANLEGIAKGEVQLVG